MTLGAVVRGIRHHDDGVVVTTRDGRTFEAERVIVTIPPTLAGRIEYEPAMPSWRDQLTQRVPMGSVIKLYAVYETPFWRDLGLNGQVGSDTGPVKITFDNSPPGYGKGIMLGFLEGNDGREWARRTPDERRDAFVECLVGYFGEGARNPIEYLEQDWTAEEFSRGCYGAHFTPGVWTAYGTGAARTRRQGPLGGHRVLPRLERLHGGRGALGRDDGRRGAGRTEHLRHPRRRR